MDAMNTMNAMTSRPAPVRSHSITQRQQQLLLRSALLRQDAAGALNLWRQPLARLDRWRAGLQWLQQHPVWPVSAVAVVAVLRPRRTLVWASRLWWVWGTFKRIRQQLLQPTR
jgi:hypothetical protein